MNLIMLKNKVLAKIDDEVSNITYEEVVALFVEYAKENNVEL